MTIDDKYKKVIITFILWFVGALVMTVAYTWLKSTGFIWDSPDCIVEMRPCDTYDLIRRKEAGLSIEDCMSEHSNCNFIPWNTRKVIFVIAGLFWFTIACVRIGSIVNAKNTDDNG